MKQSIILISATLLVAPFFLKKETKKIAAPSGPKMCYLNRFDRDWLESAPFDPAFYKIEKTVARRSVNAMTDTSRAIVSYRKAIETMRKRPATDPTSWEFQAAMHGNTKKPPRNEWDQCQHNNAHFLSWHRMYLYFFERIVRKASGDPTFALPFWDYSAANGRVLPKPFRQPAKDSNPLFTRFRDDQMNDGATLSNSEASSQKAFLAKNLIGGTTSFQYLLEQAPHGTVHMGVAGTKKNWMGDFVTAGQDPLFWLHHCQIDRLWEKWMIERGQPYPTDNRDWMQREFLFYDENGKSVRMTGSQIINTAAQLGYFYEGLKYPASGPATAPMTTAKKDTAVSTVVQKADGQKVKTSGSSVGLQKTNAKNSKKRSMGLPPDQYQLILRGIALEKARSGAYEVYLNLPKGADFDPDGDHFAGVLNFFDLESTGERRLLVTDAIQKLRAKGIDTGQLEVTFFFRPRLKEGQKLPKKQKAAEISIASVELAEVDE